MIRPLRKAHLGASVLMLALLPAGWVVAVRARVTMPVVPEAEEPGANEAGTDLSSAWTGVDIDTRLLPDGQLLLTPRVDLRRPDVLVYWRPAAAEGLADATLLGTLAGTQRRRFDLPDAARGSAGELVLYGLAHQETVATAPLAALSAEGD